MDHSLTPNAIPDSLPVEPQVQLAPKFDIIILNWNGREWLRGCLDSLRSQTDQAFEITLVDNGSSDGSVEFLAQNYPEVRVLALEENTGFCRGNNHGAFATRHEWVIILNNDTVCAPDLLEKLAAGIAHHPEFSLFSCKLLRLKQNDRVDNKGIHFTRGLWASQIDADTPDQPDESPREVFGPSGSALVVRRSVIESIGLFDERFFLFHEDVDFVVRARLQGYRCLYLPEAVVYHHGDGSCWRVPRQRVYYSQRNMEAVVFKNISWKLLWRSGVPRLLYMLYQILRHIPRGMALLVLRAKYDGWRMGLKLRREHPPPRDFPPSFEAALRGEFPAIAPPPRGATLEIPPRNGITAGSVLMQRSLVTFGAQVLVLLCAVLNNFLIARALGPEGKGQTYLVFMASGLLVSLLMGGIDQAMIYYLGRDLFRRDVVLATATAFAASASALGIGLFWLAPQHWRDVLFRGLPVSLQWTALAAVPILFLLLTWTFYTLALNRVVLHNLLRSLPTLIFTALLAPALVFLQHRATLVVTVWFFSMAVAFCVSLFLVNRQVRFRPAVSLEFARRGLSFGLKSHVGTILQFFNYRLDSFMVNYWWGGAQVGLYSIAVAIAEILWFMPRSAVTVIGPEISRRGTEGANQLTPWVCRNVLGLSAAGAGALYLVSRPLIGHLLPAFLPALPVLGVLLPGVVAICLTQVISSDLTARGKPQVPTYAAFASTALALLLYLRLIPGYGMWGAAVASTIAYTLSALLSLAFFIAVTKVKLSEMVIPRLSDYRRYSQLYTDLRGRLSGRSAA